MLWLLLFPVTAFAQGEGALRLFAAASLGEAAQEVAALWHMETGQDVRISLAGTATLARQIAAGAPADVFLSANAAWMTWAQERGLVAAADVTVFATNTLVMIAPETLDAPLELTRDAVRARLQSGRLAMGLPGAVPAGTYGREALQTLGLWFDVEPRVAGTDSVRAALALVALGAAPLGVVYATDVRAEPRVREVARFPTDSHGVIAYHAAPVSDAPGAAAFVAFLASDAGQGVLHDLGFGPAPSEQAD